MSMLQLAKHPQMTMSAGAASTTGAQITEVMGGAANVLLVFDPALEALGLADRVADSIGEAGHTLHTFSDLQSDPKESSVDAATRLAHDKDVRCVVGLGGGSGLDTAKLVSVLADSGAACAAYRLAAEPLPFRRTALICLPTTAGTGAETTSTSIISQADGTKNWFWGSPLKGDLALMDPELTVGLPAFWTFFTGMDALVHSIESRTNRYCYADNNPIAERGIMEAATHLQRATRTPDDIEARAGMMRAAAFGGLAIGNTGCAVAHNIGHALGSIAGVPHGRAVSIALLATLDWAVEGNRAAFDRVGELLGGSGAADVGPALRRMAEACGFELALSDEEKAKVDVERLAADMMADANVAMLEATARDADRDDAYRLAQATLAA